jgi:peptidoglycan/LPS O-acetylase OafA/YrhL
VTTPHTARPTVVFVELMRALAVAFVLYAHFIGHPLGETWWPARQVERFVFGPLGVIQSSGLLGICLFFLVSGYIISHVGVDESRREFAVKRLFRIYPPLVTATLLGAGVAWLRHLAGDAGAPAPPGPGTLLAASTLVGYLMVPQRIVLAVAWTLTIEMIFYAAVLLLLPVLRARAWLAVAALLAGVHAVLLLARDFGQGFLLFALCVSYLPVLALGQLLWARATGRIGWPAFAALSACAWLGFVRGLEVVAPRYLDPAESYGVSVAFAYALFVAALLAGPALPRWTLARLVAERSYGLFLVHGPVMIFVRNFLPLRGEAQLVAMLVASLAMAELLLRLVERPSQAFARRWLRAEDPGTACAGGRRRRYDGACSK